ncbi:MAG: sugar ABC transporter permease [Firmicutes bacterium]|nr:sugar ABC transporter permease [Bacillota bacterium]
MKSPKGLFGSKINRKRTIEGYLFASPWFLGFFLFTAGPMIVSFVMSFFNYDVLTPASYIGFDNYRVIFTDDPLFWKALYNTFFYAFFQIPSYLVVSLVVAIMMNQKIRGIRVFRTLYYLPAVTAGPATMMLWLWLFDPSSGLINQALWALGIYDTPLWLQSEVWSKPSLILMSLWYAGSSMVIYLAGLQGIPQELYDAASVDGAGTWRQFWKITLPMLSPTIFFNLIMGIINAFQIFEQAYLMTEGGPMNSTMFYALYLYYNAFKWLKMGYASALAWVLFAIILILTLIQFKFANRWVYYELADRG